MQAIKVTWSGFDSNKIIEFIGFSAEEKPALSEKENGSTVLEIDTGKVWIWHINGWYFLNNINNAINEYLPSLASQIFNRSKAYTDMQIKTLTPTQLFLHGNGTMSLAEPTGPAITQDINITTSEAKLFEFVYAIPESGILSKDNVYNVRLWTYNGSNEKDIFLRFKYKVAGTQIFDFTTKRPRTTDPYEVNQSIVNELEIDTPYSAGAEARLEIWGRITSGSRQLRFVFNDVDNLNILIRNIVA